MQHIKILNIYSGSSKNTSFIEFELNCKTTLLSMPNFIKRHGEEIINTFRKRKETSVHNRNGVRIMKSA
jgi:hypothetical protein